MSCGFWLLGLDKMLTEKIWWPIAMGGERQTVVLTHVKNWVDEFGT